MKLFSRKSLVAGATAIAVSFAGVNVATAEESTSQPTAGAQAGDNQDGQGNEGQTGDDKDQNDNSGSSIDDLSSSEGKDGEKVDPDEIKAWIGVVSAIIGVLGSIFAFITKYVDLPGQK
ncbi:MULTISPECIES: hypothetical protein [unclassified Corynebacterium]|uniref:hypothetical protein n=1 Tax=unclassified Corynebacterium TaxID=2624378 RepID=UPI0034CF0B8E